MVKNRTDYLYRYFDATPQAEYLYDRVIDTVRRDLREEVLFVEVFDRAVNAVMDRIDMPNRKAAQLVKLVMQNGRVGADKRAKLFPELTASEIDALETIVREAGTPPAGPVQDGVSPADPDAGSARRVGRPRRSRHDRDDARPECAGRRAGGVGRDSADGFDPGVQEHSLCVRPAPGDGRRSLVDLRSRL